MKRKTLTWALTCAATICSWAVAVLLLVTALRFLAVTPGYLPDHLE